MRCPKCGYISFDHLEACRKCKKDISAAADELEGVVYQVTPPTFLTLDSSPSSGESREEGNSAENAGQETELSFADELDQESGEIEIDLGEVDEEGEAGIDLSLGDGEDLDLDFGDEEEDTGDEIVLNLPDEEENLVEAPADEDEGEGLPIDFGKIDISDLAPPEEPGGEEEELLEESLSLDDEPEPAPVLAEGAPHQGAASSPGSGLEDLLVDDLDLDTPAPLVAGSKAGGKLMPSVRTGTALDDFEIDLGELTKDMK